MRENWRIPADSKHAQSDADFLRKMSIAYKEADESDYWLSLLHDNGYLEDKQYDSIYADADELVRILVARCKKLDSESEKE